MINKCSSCKNNIWYHFDRDEGGYSPYPMCKVGHWFGDPFEEDCYEKYDIYWDNCKDFNKEE